MADLEAVRIRCPNSGANLLHFDCNRRVTMMKVTLQTTATALLLATVPATADEGRFQLEKSSNGYVRLDTQTGEMSICRQQQSQLVCRVAAEERAAFQDEIDRLDLALEALERRMSAIEKDSRLDKKELPSDEEFERTLGYMEKFLRRFKDIIEDFDKPSDDKKRHAPDRT